MKIRRIWRGTGKGVISITSQTGVTVSFLYNVQSFVFRRSERQKTKILYFKILPLSHLFYRRTLPSFWTLITGSIHLPLFTCLLRLRTSFPPTIILRFPLQRRSTQVLLLRSRQGFHNYQGWLKCILSTTLVSVVPMAEWLPWVTRRGVPKRRNRHFEELELSE